ncbi:MAG: hypothetical protein ACLFWF_03745 [Alphaproteobacteria bacterium]
MRRLTPAFFQVEFMAWNERERNFIPRGRMSLNKHEYIDLRQKMTPEEVIGDDIPATTY